MNSESLVNEKRLFKLLRGNYFKLMQMKKVIVGLALIFLSITVITVSAFVYDSATQTTGQTVVNVATFTLKNSALGNIDEGETKSYLKAEVPALGAAITLTNSKSLYLHLDSDIESLSATFSTYTITVKYLTVPMDSSHIAGQTATALTLASPDSTAIALDAAGTWVFDFELNVTAKQVASDTVTTATIVATAQSS
jgi:hypothetical protein